MTQHRRRAVYVVTSRSILTQNGLTCAERELLRACPKIDRVAWGVDVPPVKERLGAYDAVVINVDPCLKAAMPDFQNLKVFHENVEVLTKMGVPVILTTHSMMGFTPEAKELFTKLGASACVGLGYLAGEPPLGGKMHGVPAMKAALNKAFAARGARRPSGPLSVWGHLPCERPRPAPLSIWGSLRPA